MRCNRSHSYTKRVRLDIESILHVEAESPPPAVSRSHCARPVDPNGTAPRAAARQGSPRLENRGLGSSLLELSPNVRLYDRDFSFILYSPSFIASHFTRSRVWHVCRRLCRVRAADVPLSQEKVNSVSCARTYWPNS